LLQEQTATTLVFFPVVPPGYAHFYLILADVRRRRWVVFDSKGDQKKWQKTHTYNCLSPYFANLGCMWFSNSKITIQGPWFFLLNLDCTRKALIIGRVGSFAVIIFIWQS
jgi:hypothetical protein